MDEDDLCYQCQDTIHIAALYLVQFTFLLIFIVLLFFGSDAFVNQVEFILLNLRCVFAKWCLTVLMLTYTLMPG